ncbi:60S Ribosomal Protein L13 [Manis pentadactyla]|nr:60S Ribosomal Protein L13 [Manis pentadactyla]
MNCPCGDKAGVRGGVRDAESRGQLKRAKDWLQCVATCFVQPVLKILKHKAWQAKACTGPRALCWTIRAIMRGPMVQCHTTVQVGRRFSLEEHPQEGGVDHWDLSGSQEAEQVR